MESFTLVIFGVTGNLAALKLLPALYDLAVRELLPEDFEVIGIGRQAMSVSEFHAYFDKVVHQDNRHHQHPIEPAVAAKLITKSSYLQGDFTDKRLFETLQGKLKNRNKLFYLATYPSLYETIFEQLQSHQLNVQSPHWSRLMIEKPIGNDLPSAQKLNQLLLKYFVEDQIFRLDHYLGKETLQNILTFRFGNGIYEPLINSEYVDHIQVTAAEDFGIGKRGGYYDTVGALKDVGQNHLLQMIALSTMESPVNSSTKAVTEQRVALLKSLQADPHHLVLGQYAGYQSEANVAPGSQTDTFFAFKTTIANERFKDVPVYVRGGKYLAQMATEISIVFKLPHNRLFSELHSGTEPNVLVYRVQPNDGIVLKILAKTPGHELQLTPAYMQFCYKHVAGQPGDPYEKLIYDALRGDQTFFNDAPEVEAQWKFIDTLTAEKTSIHLYEKGTWGPKAADDLIRADGREWLVPSVEFCPL